MTEVVPWKAKLEQLQFRAKQRPATEEDLDTYVRSPPGGSFAEGKRDGEAARAAGQKAPASVLLRGWFFALLWEEEAKAWHWMAFLYPPGRGSDKSDWQFLGQAGGYLGVPLELLERVTESTQPNHTHRFSWKEEAS